MYGLKEKRQETIRMVNYSNGKIYMIRPTVPHKENEIYIGSTTKRLLSQRMSQHRLNYKYWKQGMWHYVTNFQLFDKFGSNVEIILLEAVNANSKDELSARERFHIQNNKCVNKHIQIIKASFLNIKDCIE